MNHTYIPYDLAINEPRLKPGTVVRETKPYPSRIGVVKDGRVVESVQREFWAFELVDSEWEPLPADDPEHIYPGDKVVCVESSNAIVVGIVGHVVNRGKGNLCTQVQMYDQYGDAFFTIDKKHQWAILEPATTPISEIGDGDEIVARTGDWAGQKARASRAGETLVASFHTRWVPLSDYQWLVTKKAKKDTLTMDERSRLTKMLCGATGVVTDADRGTIGHIIDDCIKRGWYPCGSPVEFALANEHDDSTEAHPYSLVGIARAYLEARGRWAKIWNCTRIP